MKKIALAVLLGVLFITCSSPLAVSYKGLKFSELLYDFGQVGTDLKVFHDFKLFNDGDKPVLVDSIEVACECSSILFPDSTINPGDTVSLKLTFESIHYYGPTRKSLTVYSSDGRKTVLQYISDVGRWPKGMKPDQAFLFFIPGQSSKKINIKNTEFEKLEILRIEPYDTVFQAAVLESEAEKGKQVTLEVKPRETLKEGTYLSSFRLALKLPEENNPFFLTIPVKIVVY